MGGEKFEGFDITAGIRQGCPLSPLLFAVVADLLLRRLKSKFPGSSRRAYADDLAMVIPNMVKEGGRILNCFSDYHRISGLQLNMSKVVIIPLWRPNPRTFEGTYRHGPSFVGPFNSNSAIIKSGIIQLYPGWGPATVSGKAKYLGFTIGPEAGDDTWNDTLSKAMKRVESWQKVGCSLFYTVTLFNVYILSTFSFICQLLDPPEEWEKQEALFLRKLIKGPWMWAGPEIFKALKQSLHFPREVGDLRKIAKAAQFRVASNEFRAGGGLLIQSRVAHAEVCQRASQHIHLHTHWGKWLAGGFSKQLCENYKRLGEAPHKISLAGIETTLAKMSPRPWDKKTMTRVVKGTQAQCLKQIKGPTDSTHLKMARELKKWQLDTYSRTHTDRAFRVLRTLRKHTIPKIMAAHYRTWMDGWTTSARMHEKGGVKPCTWCGQKEGDKLQHYCGCQKLQEWRTRRLALPKETEAGPRREQFLNLCSPENSSPNSTVIRGLALAASYHAYNACKHHHYSVSEEDATSALDQSLKEIVRGKHNLMKLVDSIWAHKKKGTTFILKSSISKLVKVPSTHKGLFSLITEKRSPTRNKLRKRPTPKATNKGAAAHKPSGKRKRVASKARTGGTNSLATNKTLPPPRLTPTTLGGEHTHTSKQRTRPNMVTYQSGWSHEAGSCAVPFITATGPKHSGRRAKFRIPLSQ